MSPSWRFCSPLQTNLRVDAKEKKEIKSTKLKSYKSLQLLGGERVKAMSFNWPDMGVSQQP